MYLSDKRNRSLTMTKLIRNKGTGRYFAAGKWVENFEEAEKFQDVLTVLETCKQHHLSDVEIVMLTGEKPSGYDVILSLKELRSR